MRDPKITELIKDALKNPKKADLDKDGKLSDYEKTRGAAIEKSMAKEDLESGQYGDPKVGNYDITSQSDNEASDIEALSAAGLEEDIDIGHEDNEPGMLQGDLYEIGKASMEIYAMLDDMEGQGEVDLPSWWQSKVYKAKEAIVGAAEYLDFELKEPAIDAVVDKVAPLDINVDPLGETVEDYITSVDDLTEVEFKWMQSQMNEVELTQDFGELDEAELDRREKAQVKKIVKQLKKSVKSHDKQAKTLDKLTKESLDELAIPGPQQVEDQLADLAQAISREEFAMKVIYDLPYKVKKDVLFNMQKLFTQREDVNEALDFEEDDVKEELNEEVARFKKLAGLIK